MSQQRRGLGKGLGALIPQGPEVSGSAGSADAPETTTEIPVEELPDGTHLAEIPVASVVPNPRQPRQHFDDEALAELTASIVEVGLLQPIVVRKRSSQEHELVMGERRWRASQEAGLDYIPAIVRDIGNDELLRNALLENLHRQELNPLEEAAAYQQLLDDFGATHDELARRIGRSRPHITNTLRLLNLSPPVQRRVAAGVITAGHARALLSVEDSEQQDELARRIVAEGLSVRALEELITLNQREASSTTPARSPANVDKSTSPQVDEWAHRLSDRLDTRVKVSMGQRKGRIVVEFASMEDLERIAAMMSDRDSSSR
ncbi:ParB/RepB/Spo0J family partition protein [Lipingzhangella sp. LS1_29]|uniref:ParB/RepB/Spo0J family partition protein n=1 Tax=Lipingzhangella rawalii TaxID=2055835 RepID=A0ABU2H842_9ACTN|nr:ParB/RepB/Spo0J family partition protein [Lipingzhangella rawalii]MDS1271467.1 ParB/RepB/Spo0J family partition protein [Lipingzhangella rawalii]